MTDMAKRIAIVEDDPDQRSNYTDAITKKGYDVTAYASRQEALEGIEQQLPDLAILDIILGDGFDPRREAVVRWDASVPPPLRLPPCRFTSRSKRVPWANSIVPPTVIIFSAGLISVIKRSVPGSSTIVAS